MQSTQTTRRDFLKAAGIGAAGLALPSGALGWSRSDKRPNIIFILADDLGYGELGCYGQTKIKTPNLDRLAAGGMRFTQFYSGSPVCAPSRCTLLTGKHTGHAYIRNNSEKGGWGRDAKEGQEPLPAGAMTLGRLLQQSGYTTGAFGKWGLGGPDSSGHPNLQGFDHWYGYLCQRVAHNYYPTHLWRNGEKHMLEGNEYFSAHQRLKQPPVRPEEYEHYNGKQYAPDLMIEEALGFIRKQKGNPFFLYYATPVPHVSLQVPDDSLEEYRDLWEETPYLGQKSYLPHPTPRACYAGMITRMDRDIGRMLALLRELGLEENTLVMFSSDNGATFNGGTEADFFGSVGPLRGLKCDLYEGGIRVPMIARWPGKIKAGTTSEHPGGFWDVLPTISEISGTTPPRDIDGVSFLPTLLGREDQKEHEYLYWEYSSRGGGQAVRMGRWKGLRLKLAKQPDAAIELYDLQTDVGEQHNLAARHPEIVNQIREIMKTARTHSDLFPLS